MPLTKSTGASRTSQWASQAALVQTAQGLEGSRETFKQCILGMYKAAPWGFVKSVSPTSASKRGFSHSAQSFLAQLDIMSC